MSTQLDFLLKHIEELKQDKKNYEQKIDKLQNDNKQEIDKLRDEHKQEKNQYEHKIDKLQSEYKQELDKLRDEHKQEKNQYEQKIDKLQNEHKQEKDKLESKIDKQEQEHKKEINDIAEKFEKTTNLSENESYAAISTLKTEKVNKLATNLEIVAIMEADEYMYLPSDSKFIKENHKYKNIDWNGTESSNNRIATDHFVKHLKKVGFDDKNFKIIDISNDKNFFECNFLNLAQNIRGTADAAIVPKRLCSNESVQLRVLIEFKTTTSFDKKNGQIIGEIIASNYCSKHPSILVKTDLNEKFEIHQMRKNVIYVAKYSPEKGFKAVAHWLSICSTSPTFDWRQDKHSFDEDLIYPLKYFHDKFQVRIKNEFECMLKEHLEIIEMADADLQPFEKYLSIRQFFQNFFNS